MYILFISNNAQMITVYFSSFEYYTIFFKNTQILVDNSELSCYIINME